MDFKEIMSISGHPGLFKYISQGRNGIIVEAFTDHKRSFVSASNKVSSLEDIAIFTSEEEVPLKQVFKNIYEMEQGGLAPDPKSSPDELKAYLAKILPNYDREKVYVSDIKKLVSWYNALHELNLLVFDDEPEASEPVKEKEPVKEDSETVQEEKPNKQKG